jgi:cell wall-associated NlpC family hydrolase
MTEAESRAQVVAIARSWSGTPYLSNAAVKGAGVDCAMLPRGVYQEAGFIPAAFDPRPYPPQWHMHRGEERYLAIANQFAHEVAGPPQRVPQPGDFVLFKIGRLFAHGAIVTAWPNIIHARAPVPVQEEDISTNNFGKHALWNVDKRFFSAWPE